MLRIVETGHGRSGHVVTWRLRDMGDGESAGARRLHGEFAAKAFASNLFATYGCRRGMVRTGVVLSPQGGMKVPAA